MNGGQIYLRPGEVFFDRGQGEVRTLLGSCVALTLWHPQARVGGMCHYVLPGRRDRKGAPPDGRYGDEALEILVTEMRQAGTRPEEYQTGIFGGGNMFPDFNMLSGRRVGEQNVAMAQRLARHYGLVVMREELGGSHYRHVTLTLSDGSIRLRTTAVQGA